MRHGKRHVNITNTKILPKKKGSSAAPMNPKIWVDWKHLLRWIIIFVMVLVSSSSHDPSAESYVGRASEILRRDNLRADKMRSEQIKKLDDRERERKGEEESKRKDPYLISSSELENRDALDAKESSIEEAKEAEASKLEEENEKAKKDEETQEQADEMFRKWLKTKGPMRKVHA